MTGWLIFIYVLFYLSVSCASAALQIKGACVEGHTCWPSGEACNNLMRVLYNFVSLTFMVLIDKYLLTLLRALLCT